jgi:phage terminase large subunit GpA-like protein
MDSASTRWVRRVAIIASTQVGKTEAASNVIGYCIEHQPSPVMLVMPRGVDASMAMEKRIEPMVRASPVLLAELTDRKHDAKKREIQFRRSVLYFRAATSPADLASVPCRVVCCDEVDKWNEWTGREAKPLALVTSRTHTFPNSHLLFITSTPTTRRGTITQEYEDGDQRRYFLPCPHCGAFQTLQWQRIKWDHERVQTAKDMRTVREAWYECEACSARIDEKHKPSMLAQGVWCPAKWTVQQWLGGERERDRTSHRSYQIWVAYSPWVPWHAIVSTFLKATVEGPEAMMDFVNSYLAEVWEDRVENIADATVAACIEDRQFGDVPEAVLVVTGAVDVQGDRLEWSVHGWGMDEESWLIACGKCATWEQLDDVFFANLWGAKQLQMRCVLIDSRYRRGEVIDWARKHQSVVRMIAGVERDTPLPFSTAKIDRHPRTGAALPTSMTVWTVNVSLFKDIVAARMQLAVDAPDQRKGRLHLPDGLPTDWLVQMASEHKVRVRSGKRYVQRWVLKPNHRRNEAWDLCVYQAAAARLVRVDTLRSDAPPPAQPKRLDRDGMRRRKPMYPTFGGR